MQADAVYTRVPAFSLMMARLGQPHFLEVHDTHTLDAQGYIPRLLREYAKGVLRGITAISGNARQALLDKGFPDDHVTILPSGVDLDSFSEFALPRLEDFVAPKTIYIGRISRDRGLPLFERIAESGFPVTIVGPRDHEPTHAHQNLTVLDPIPHAEVPGTLGRASIALMPYQADLRHAASISPIKLFEAMAAGRLVLASDLPPIREVVCDGKNGLLLPPDNPESWVSAIERVRANPAWALEMARRGSETAREYSWDARARNLINFLESNSN
jgi:glycosyltransferase involved in cell wall biosynthesis